MRSIEEKKKEAQAVGLAFNKAVQKTKWRTVLWQMALTMTGMYALVRLIGGDAYTFEFLLVGGMGYSFALGFRTTSVRHEELKRDRRELMRTLEEVKRKAVEVIRQRDEARRQAGELLKETQEQQKVAQDFRKLAEIGGEKLEQQKELVRQLQAKLERQEQKVGEVERQLTRKEQELDLAMSKLEAVHEMRRKASYQRMVSHPSNADKYTEEDKKQAKRDYDEAKAEVEQLFA